MNQKNHNDSISSTIIKNSAGNVKFIVNTKNNYRNSSENGNT